MKLGRHYLFIIISTATIILTLIYYLNNKKLDYITITNNEKQVFNHPDKNRVFDLIINYKIEPEKCRNNTSAIILVTSHFNHVEVRSSMRRSFDSSGLEEMGLKRIFLLGESNPETPTITQKSIRNEGARFKDLLQGNFTEAYRNLTYKHIMGLKWAANNCWNAKYVIKMDDDIVIDLHKIVPTLLDVKLLKPNLLAGYVLRNLAPVREKQNKWYVTYEEYKGNKYPPFLSGWFYITTPKICAQFVELSQDYKYFWIDDLFITGILAQKLRIKHYDIGQYFSVHAEFFDCCIKDLKKGEDCGNLQIGPNGGDNDLFFKFNEALRMCRDNGCRERSKPLNDTCVAEKRFHLGRGNPVIETYRLH